MIELLVANENGSQIYQPAVEEGIEWATQRSGTPGKLTFKVLKDDIMNFTEGCAVRLKDGEDKIFSGFIFTQ